MSFTPDSCTLCPRACKGDRTRGRGLCGATDRLKVARAAPHMWEEPCISGKNGSGAVFFSGCVMGCVFCQNFNISTGGVGKEIDEKRFEEICFELKDKGVHNINLVTPSHYAPILAPVLGRIRRELALPIVCNCSGYESDEILDLLLPVTDVFLPDLKFFSSEISMRYAGCPDYFDVAMHAVERMVKKTGKPVFDGAGMLVSGTMVRHLILPGCRADSVSIIRELGARFGADDILISLMSQYLPNGNPAAPSRRITTFEYESVAKEVVGFGFSGYFQERGSAAEEYIPPFDLEGVTKE